jgi:small subunit ribosomal protein S1
VRVFEGIEGLVHISELATRHVELPEQVVSPDDDVFVKIIDIDLERRRISLSIKQANEGVDPEGEDFDPALYGMTAEYDDNGEYKFPEGFDPETQEWREGFDEQREAWEAEYAKAHERWEAHKKFVAASDAAAAEAEAAAPVSSGKADTPNSFSSEGAEDEGTLASDERLAALREKLTGE